MATILEILDAPAGNVLATYTANQTNATINLPQGDTLMYVRLNRDGCITEGVYDHCLTKTDMAPAYDCTAATISAVDNLDGNQTITIITP